MLSWSWSWSYLQSLQEKGNIDLLADEFRLCTSREVQLPTQSKLVPAGKSAFVLDIKADIVVGFNADSKIDEYNFKVVAVNSDV